MILVHENDVRTEGSEVTMKSLFSTETVNYGIVHIPVGARIPLQDTSAHEEDEYSYIIKGSLMMESGGKQYRVEAGNATLIPAGESHWCSNDGHEEAIVVWALVHHAR